MQNNIRERYIYIYIYISPNVYLPKAHEVYFMLGSTFISLKP